MYGPVRTVVWGLGVGDCPWPPDSQLSASERQRVLDVANQPEMRNLSPKQIVPALADQGKYVCSESTMYRVLHAAGQLNHRSASARPTAIRPRQQVATGPNQIWSWDITYLRSPVRGAFFYLYMIMDVWSRKVVAWTVHDVESSQYASDLVELACAEQGVCRDTLTLHADNGASMRGSTLLATLQTLGVVPSFSRPRVSDDNPFSESLFRTLKYRPCYPRRPFVSVSDARLWVAGFVHWYNAEHRHSGLRFVTPNEQHYGHAASLLAARAVLYERARLAHPERWSGATRNWTIAGAVTMHRRGAKPALAA